MAITRGLPSQNLEELLSELVGSQNNGELIQDLELLPAGDLMTLDSDNADEGGWVEFSVEPAPEA